MNRKHIIICLLMALPLLFTSCLKDQEEVFSKSASARTAEYLANVKRVLTSSQNGWVLNYYPDRDHSYGGFIYTLKFAEDSVTVYSEIATDINKSVSSLYTLKNEDGPVLMFDTYNELMHFFATPHGSSGAGGYEAYDGDFIFIVMDISKDENTITLKGNRSGNIMYMHRLTGDTMDGYINKIDSVKRNFPFKYFMMIFNQTDTVTGTYSRSTIGGAGGSFTFTYTEDSVEQEKTVPIHYTPEGIVFNDTVTILGNAITGVRYSEEYKDTIPSLNNPNIYFYKVVPPLSEQFLTGYWFIAYSQLGTYGQNCWSRVKSGLEGIGEELYYAYLADEDGFGLHFGSYAPGASVYTGSLFLNTDALADDVVAMQFAKTGAGDGVWYHNNAGFGYALLPFGYSAAKTFKLTADDNEQPTILILSDMADESNVITLLATETVWPFEN